MTDNKGMIVKNWCEENRTPVQELCPRIIQSWKSSMGTVFWDSVTGNRSYTNPSNKYAFSVRRMYYGLYVRYIPELDALEISGVKLEGNRGKDGEIKQWEYGREWGWMEDPYRYFIFKGTTTAYDEYGTEIKGKLYKNETVINHIKVSGFHVISDRLENEVYKFCGYNDEYGMNYGWQFVNWYEKYFMPRKSSKNSDIINISLPQRYIQPFEGYGRMLVFDKVNDEWAVIRAFDSDFDATTIKESCRCYINKKGKMIIAAKMWGETEWAVRKSNGYHLTKNESRTHILNKEEFLTWQPLKYVMPCLGDNPSLMFIITALRHPIIEQLCKCGYPYIANRLIGNYEVKANLRKYFDAEETKEPIYKMLGVNKWILKATEDSIKKDKWAIRDFVYDTKQLYGKNDISDLSKETVDMLISTYELIQYNDIAGIYVGWRHRNIAYTEEQRNTVIKLCKAEKKHPGIARLFSDTISIFNRIRRENRPDINIRNYDTYDNLVRIHNGLVAIQVREEEERRAIWDEVERERKEKEEKAFRKLQEERIKKYEYTDGEFAVVVPKELSEINIEGVQLSHCVGGYVNRHAFGYTNILFLRKVSEIAHSFYTIEINNNQLIQIHGRYNRWLGNDPDAIPFVYEYLNKIGVSFDRQMLLNTSVGYCPNNVNLPETVLYRKKEVVA